MFAVVMEPVLHGVSTREVDDLVKALGADSGISKSELSGPAQTSTRRLPAFRDRSLAGAAFPVRVPRRDLLPESGSEPPVGAFQSGGGSGSIWLGRDP